MFTAPGACTPSDKRAVDLYYRIELVQGVSSEGHGSIVFSISISLKLETRSILI